MSDIDFYYLNSILDYESLEAKFNFAKYKENKFKQLPTHCTGVVYPNPDMTDIYFS